MGVDIETYRCRIGTFQHGPGLDVILLRVCVNYNGGLKMVGVVTFIGILLIMAGVETNPGPLDKPNDNPGESDIRIVLKKIGLDEYTQIFEENMIRPNEIELMSADDFRDIGISAIGIRLRIQDACKQHLKVESDIRIVLKKIGLDEYTQIFEDNMIRPNEVELMSADDFRDIGIPAIGIRLRIKEACKKHLKDLQCIARDDLSDTVEVEQKHEKAEHTKLEESSMSDAGIHKTDSTDLDEERENMTEEMQQLNIDRENKMKQNTEMDDHLEEIQCSTGATDIAGDKPVDTGVPISTISTESVASGDVVESREATLNVSKEISEQASSNDISDSNLEEQQESEQSMANEDVKESNMTTSDVTKENFGESDFVHESSLNDSVHLHQKHPRDQPDIDTVLPIPTVSSQPRVSDYFQECTDTNVKDSVENSGQVEYEEDNTDSNQGEQQDSTNSKGTSDIHDIMAALLARLELTKWFPGKISYNDVTAIDVYENSMEIKHISNVPWLVLKRIIMANKNARDQTVEEYEDENEGECGEDIEELCPLDVFVAIFHCCDAFLKQLLYSKMFMCKLAIPFLYRDPNSCSLTVPVWPLRPTVTEWIDSNGTPHEDCFLEQPTKIITFARFGRPIFSKSKLQNDILSDHKQDSFFNKDCPLGMTNKSLGVGYVEASWFIPGGTKVRGEFNEVLTFANVRGDLFNIFSVKEFEFIKHISTVFVIVLDVQTLRTNLNRVTRAIETISLLLMIVTNSGNTKETDVKDSVSRLTEIVEAKGNEVIIILTQKHKKERNASDMEKTIRIHLEACLKKASPKHLSTCFKDLSMFDIKSDEEDPECIAGLCLADTLISIIKQSGPQEKWKSLITPLQYSCWKQWSILKKKLHRSFNQVDDTEKIKKEMKDIRKSQMGMVSETMTFFVKTVVSNAGKKQEILYFIKWLKLYLESMSRRLLPGMRKRYNDAWNKLKEMRSEIEENDNVILKQEQIVKNLEENLAEAAFDVEHLFREMGQIYEASVSLKVSIPDMHMQDIAKSMATLITYGHALELLDGDASNIPIDWVKSVLNAVKNLTGCKKIMTLSVLGIQSSGKSTMLNTMFGLQFSVSAGRCSRGVYMQLLPISKSSGLPFDHVMAIDSEGLRAPELLEQQKVRDNELATLVIGLGDISLLNIKGENTSEINDILEITVRAFLRLKATKKTLDLRQTCLFTHQNVSAINTDKMLFGIQKLEENMDKMTKEAAIGENIHDVTSFKQVINFDGSTHVWYLPDLWQGGPPMASTNVEYSQKVSELKYSFMQMAVADKDKSYKSMDDILSHTADLWKGILAEDFVFSFRNSLEMKAYLLVETEYKQLTWQLESFVQIQTLEKSKNKFSACQTDNEVDTTEEAVLESLTKKLDEMTKELQSTLEKFFEHCDYREIVVNWKESKLISMNLLSMKLRDAMEIEIRHFVRKRKVQIMITTSHKQHEERLHQESIKLAKSLRGKDLSPTDTDIEYERIWNRCIQGIQNESEVHYKPMKTIFTENLRSIFNTESSALSETLNRYTPLYSLHRLSQLHGSFDNSEIGEDDISNQLFPKDSDIFKNKNKLQHLQEITNVFFQKIDLQINELLQEDDEIGNLHVAHFLHTLTECFEQTLNESKKIVITLATSYRLKVYVYISWHAQHLFEQHNERYRATYGIMAQLEKYKVQVRTRFEAYLNERKAEATAAKLFRNEVEAFVTQTVEERLKLRVENALMMYLPNLKFHLITDMLTDLAENAVFSDFIDYIQSPETHANLFISRMSTRYLFDGQTHKYIDLALNEISVIVSDISYAIIQASKACNQSENNTIHDWIEILSKSLIERNMEVERFRDVKRENVVDFENFQSNLQSEISNVESSVRAVFDKHTVESITRKKSNPYASVFDRIWGCKINCAFCGEPCSKSSDHTQGTATNHTCIQHRPSGVKGVRNVKSNLVSLSSCNFDIQSDCRHGCRVFGFLCNSTEQTDCSEIWHKYKDYRTYLPSWDIEPSSDMADTCKVWMWFMAKYRKELATLYSYRVDNIPETWEDITKEDALESLRQVYKANAK